MIIFTIGCSSMRSSQLTRSAPACARKVHNFHLLTGVQYCRHINFLRNQSLTLHEMRDAMLVRSHRLHAKCKDARSAEGTAKQDNNVCPLCERATDDARHALGDDCKHGDIWQLITSGMMLLSNVLVCHTGLGIGRNAHVD